MASSNAVLRLISASSSLTWAHSSLAACSLAENACDSAQAWTSSRPVAGDFGENGLKKEANLFEISEETSAEDSRDWFSGRGRSVGGERLISVSSMLEPSGAFAGAPSSEVGDEGGMEPGASSFGLTSRSEAVRPPAISTSTAEEEMTVSLPFLSAEGVSFLMLFAGEGCLGALPFLPYLT